jgi:tetratricopeptide (TPR) repeat protein
MAPEQLDPLTKPTAEPPTAVPTDARPGDVFACGVVLFEPLTGRHPFNDPGALPSHLNRNEVAATLRAAQRMGVRDPGALNSRVRRAVREAVLRCLASDPRERPTAAELAKLFATPSPRRWALFTGPLLAGVGVLALVLSYVAPGTPVPTHEPTHDSPPSAPPADPPAAHTPFERGLALYRQGQHGLAAVEFLAVGKTDQDGRAYGYAAYCLSAGRDPMSAIAASDEAIRLGYRTAPAYANRAYNHFQSGRLKEAKADCDDAIRLDPDLRAARFTRAAIHLQMYHLKGTAVPREALDDINMVTSGASNSPDVWYTAAHLYLVGAAGVPPSRDRAAEAIRKAVLAGKSPDSLRRHPLLKTALAGHPVYEEALTLRPGPLVPVPNPHLANPIP